MQQKRRLIASAVVCGAAVAACVGGLKYGSTEQGLISLSVGTNPYNFGTVDVGASASANFQFSPATLADDDTILTVTLSSGCTQFLFSGPPPIGSGGTARVYYLCMGSGSMVPQVGGSGSQTCIPETFDFNVTFQPTQPNSVQCVATFAYMHTGGSGGSAYMLTLNGSGNQPVGMDVSPPSINFGGVPIGLSGTAQITVTNTGTGQIDVTASESDPSNVFTFNPALNPFALVNNGDNRVFDVSCTPQALGPVSGSVTFTAAQGSNGTTTLDCEGIDSNLDITTPIVFAKTLVGLPPMNETVNILNRGPIGILTKVQLDATALAAGVSVTMNPQGSSLANGATTQAVLHYTAAAEHPSGPLGNLIVKISTDANDRLVPILGEALKGAVATNPSVVDFKAMCANSMKTIDLDIYAPAEGDIELDSITKPANAVFDVTPTTFGGGVTIRGNHAEDQTVQVSAHPTAAGSIMDKLVVNTNIPGMNKLDVDVKVTALPPGITPSPEIVHFGALAINQTSGGQEVLLTNCGTGPLDITGARIEGPNAMDFIRVLPTDLNITVQPTQSQAFTLVMTPHGDGQRTATFNIDYVGGVATVDLDGNGFNGSNTGGGKDRETYYACSTGHAVGLWPVAVALLALRRRRR